MLIAFLFLTWALRRCSTSCGLASASKEAGRAKTRRGNTYTSVVGSAAEMVAAAELAGADTAAEEQEADPAEEGQGGCEAEATVVSF